MGNFIKTNQNPLKYVRIKVADHSHIYLRDKQRCQRECENKPCTYFCPTRVYSWSGEDKEIKVDYQRCVECGACPWGCPYDNISWSFPPGGYGVHYEV